MGEIGLGVPACGSLPKKWGSGKPSLLLGLAHRIGRQRAAWVACWISTEKRRWNHSFGNFTFLLIAGALPTCRD